MYLATLEVRLNLTSMLAVAPVTVMAVVTARGALVGQLRSRGDREMGKRS